MKKWICALGLLLLLARPLSAQVPLVAADQFRLNTGPCHLSSGTGTPEGIVTGNVCDMYIDIATGTWWTKWTGTATTAGWNVGHNASARVNGNLNITGYVGEPAYVSQLANWRITGQGAADFRYLFTDELHAKAFIADLEQALAGGQIICKSVAMVGAPFTIPAPGANAVLTVRDLPSAADQAVFQEKDYVGLRTFNRSGGGLTIADVFGVVSGYADGADGTQTWNFSRGAGVNGGGLTTGTVIAVDALAIDYGVSGNGCYEVNAIDGLNGVNSPYAQTWTWTGSPINANRTLTTRTGNLLGISGNPEYGFLAARGYAGDWSAAQYIVASNQRLDLVNVDLTLFSGGAATVQVNHNVPSIALGNAIPSGYATGTGIWMGNDGGTYKFRVGNPAGNRIAWDGTVLSLFADGNGVTNINGQNIQTGTVSASRLTVGSGINQVRNSECRVSSDDWTASTTNPVTITLGFNFPGWRLHNESNTCYITFGGPVPASSQSAMYETVVHSVVPGLRYEASAHLGVQNTGDTLVILQWLDTADLPLKQQENGNVCTASTPGGPTLATWCRSGVIATAPTGAVSARIVVFTTHAGAAQPYVFMVRAYFGEALINQTELTPWGGGSITEITGGVIRTGSITADKIAANAVTAVSIAANAITGDKIMANTINADRLLAGTITAVHIAANSITADRIQTNTITALGAITAGSFNLGSGRFIVDGGGGLSASNVALNGGATISGGILMPSGGIQLSNGGFSIASGGSIVVSPMSGVGAGYVCVDGGGTFFRNNDPC